MSQVTGCFRFKMKVNGTEQLATFEIKPPGLPAEKVVQVVRGEWRNLAAPRVSQNRIECLGYQSIASPVDSSLGVKAIGPYPVVFYPPAPAP